MFISQKRCNFAHVIELERHIEVLLLSNDCVIVPDLGGFMTHHVESHYDEHDQMFIPPMRTLGFNPMLTMNDSLLVQSYVEAYDLSYPEALRRIESEVAELKHTLEVEGIYELCDIGILSRNADGKLIFEPCEAGLLTPELYGLSSFEMPQLEKHAEVIALNNTSEPVHKTEKKPNDKVVEQAPKAASVVLEPVAEEKDDAPSAIVIKMSWIRNTAAIAMAVLAFFLMTTPVSNSGHLSMSNLNNLLLMGMLPKDTNMEKIDVGRPVRPVAHITAKNDTTVVQQRPVVTIQSTESVQQPIQKVQAVQTLSAVQQSPKPPVQAAAEGNYCIVLASYVTQKNAEFFVSQLHKEGHADAQVFMRNDVRRVIYGKYASESEAYNKLSTLRDQKQFKQAWVMKIQENS